MQAAPYSDQMTISEAAMAEDRRTSLLNSVSWGAVIAGVVAALVIQVVLNILGLGIGAASLSAASAADNPTAGGASLTAGIWWIVSGIIASFVGGVVAGRLCGSGNSNTARWHGFIAWATSTLLVFALLTSAIGGIIGGTFSALGSTVGSAGKAAASAIGGAAQATDGDALQAQVRRLVKPDDAANVQDDIIAYARASLGSDQKATDEARDRAVAGLAKAANVSPDEARTRLQQVEQQYRASVDQAKQKAAEVAESTRKGVAAAGLYGSLVLVLGAIAAWIGGGVGAPQRNRTRLA